MRVVLVFVRIAFVAATLVFAEADAFDHIGGPCKDANGVEPSRYESQSGIWTLEGCQTACGANCQAINFDSSRKWCIVYGVGLACPITAWTYHGGSNNVVSTSAPNDGYWQCYVKKAAPTTATTSTPSSEYVIGKVSTNQCPTGSSSLTSSAQCQEAADLLGLTWSESANKMARPKACYVSKVLHRKNVYFNTDTSGKSWRSARPICQADAFEHIGGPCRDANGVEPSRYESQSGIWTLEGCQTACGANCQAINFDSPRKWCRVYGVGLASPSPAWTYHGGSNNVVSTSAPNDGYWQCYVKKAPVPTPAPSPISKPISPPTMAPKADAFDHIGGPCKDANGVEPSRYESQSGIWTLSGCQTACGANCQAINFDSPRKWCIVYGVGLASPSAAWTYHGGSPSAPNDGYWQCYVKKATSKPKTITRTTACTADDTTSSEGLANSAVVGIVAWIIIGCLGVFGSLVAFVLWFRRSRQ